MGYRRPPIIVQFTSAALIAGTISPVVVAAPGVGLNYRIAGAGGYISRLVGAGTIVDIQFFSTTIGFLRLGGLSIAGLPGDMIMFPEPGLPLDNNGAINANISATVAGGVAYLHLYYYIDQTT